MKSDTLSVSFWYGTILAVVLLAGISTTFFSKPTSAEAAGDMADVMCNPVIPVCGCGQIKGPKGCIKGENMFQCPCMDMTNGFPTAGKCMAPNVCKAESSGGMPPMLPMIPMPMPMPEQDQDPCATGVIADPARSGTSTQSASSTCPSSSGSGFNPFPSFDYTPVSSDVTTNTGDATAPDMVSSLLSGNINTNTNTGSTQSAGSVVPGAASTKAAAPFGSVDGVTGDVQVQGIFVRVLASNRNTARGTQVSGFYGFQTAAGIPVTTIFKSLCGLRPWSANFMAFIVPSSYFDALCTARNFGVGVTAATAGAVGGSGTGTSGSGSSGTAKPKIAPTSSAVGATVGTGVNNEPSAPTTPSRPTQYLGKARVDIWATPATVSSGQRTSIFWDTTGVYACAISSSDRSFTGSSLSGHASTQPLSQNTTFTISCQTATSTVSNQVVVPVK